MIASRAMKRIVTTHQATSSPMIARLPDCSNLISSGILADDPIKTILSLAPGNTVIFIGKRVRRPHSTIQFPSPRLPIPTIRAVERSLTGEDGCAASACSIRPLSVGWPDSGAQRYRPKRRPVSAILRNMEDTFRTLSLPSRSLVLRDRMVQSFVVADLTLRNALPTHAR